MLERARQATLENIIACDVGLKRIGLAHVVQGIILPLPAIIRRNRDQAASELAEILESRAAQILLVGLPSGGVAEHESMQRRIRHFIALVEGLLDSRAQGGALISRVQIIYIDEDYTSLNAQALLAHTGRESRKEFTKNGVLDSLAACEILARYVASQS